MLHKDRKIVLPITLGSLGVILVCIGIFCGQFVFPKYEESMIKKDHLLKSRSRAYDNWKSSKNVIKFRVYFLNVTNYSFVQRGATPTVKEVGPYVYDETRERRITKLNETTDTITFFLKKSFVYNQAESNCRSDEDKIVIINAGIVSGAHKVFGMMSSALGMFNSALPLLYPNAKDAFAHEQVKDILFKGVRVSCESEEVELICTAMKGGAAPKSFVPDENGRDFRAAMFMHINGTEDGPFEIGRGTKLPKGQIKTYKGEDRLTKWEGDECNMMNGTDGSVFSPMFKIPEYIDMFVSDFCRSMNFIFERMEDVYGLQAAIFISPDTSGKTESKKCFCPNRPNNEGALFFDCPPKGLSDTSPCVGTPVYISAPHYLNCDQKLLKYATGLDPRKDLHASYVAVEPRTGTPLLIKRRIMMSVYLRPFEEIDILKTVSEGYFPFVWIEEEMRISPEELENLKAYLKQFEAFKIIKWLLIILGIIMVIFALGYAVIKIKSTLPNKLHKNQVNNNVSDIKKHEARKAGSPDEDAIQNVDVYHTSKFLARHGRDLPGAWNSNYQF